MINFDSDADIFLNTDEFGTVATYKGGSVTVIFDFEADEGTESLLPILRVKKSAVTGIAYGDTFIVNGTSYKVLNFFDESAILVVILNEVN